MKATRKLIPALAMLLISAVVMSSASFAWFTMSRQVTAQGMNVSVTAPNNLLIKKTGDADTTYAEINTQQATNIVLVPASSNTGYSNDIYVMQDGEACRDNGAATEAGRLYNTTVDGKYTKLEAAQIATDSVAGGYYDFKYTLKTDSASNVNVVVTNVTATVKDGAAPFNTPEGKATAAKPVRVAVLLTDTTKKGDTNVVFNPNSGTNHDEGKVVEKLDNVVTDKAVLTDAAMTYATCAATNDSDQYVVTVPGNGTAEIIVRVWYEGQDTSCLIQNSANAVFDIELVLADVTYLPDP